MFHQAYHRRTDRSGLATLIMLMMMVTAVATGAFASHDAVPVAAPLHERPAMSSIQHWSPANVRQLIAAIDESERRGFDPSSYGIAALRSELDQSVELWERSGSPQLDSLAQTSALALANDVRRRSGAAPVAAADLNSALARGDLRSWLFHAGASQGDF